MTPAQRRDHLLKDAFAVASRNHELRIVRTQIHPEAQVVHLRLYDLAIYGIGLHVFRGGQAVTASDRTVSGDLNSEADRSSQSPID